MSDRRPPNLYVPCKTCGPACATPASSDQILAVVRAGVESGTIKGTLAETEDCVSGHRGHSSVEVFGLSPGTYLVIPWEKDT